MATQSDCISTSCCDKANSHCKHSNCNDWSTELFQGGRELGKQEEVAMKRERVVDTNFLVVLSTIRSVVQYLR